MNRALQIAVIADDITGAADTGVQFCPAVGPVHLTGAVEGELTATAIQTAGLAVYTNTRNIDAARAADIVRMAAERIHGLFPRVVYKKIDSCLRGNVGVEIDTMLRRPVQPPVLSHRHFRSRGAPPSTVSTGSTGSRWPRPKSAAIRFVRYGNHDSRSSCRPKAGCRWDMSTWRASKTGLPQW